MAQAQTRTRSAPWRTANVALLAAALGCGESADTPPASEDTSGGSSGEATTDAPPPPAAETCEEQGDAPLRRLTRRQYQNSVRDVLGVELDLTQLLPSDARVAAFASNAESSVTTFHVDKYATAAEKVAAAASEDLGALASCDPVTEGEQECVQRFVEEVGGRLFRRPVTADEVAALQQVYAVGRDGQDHAGGLRLTLEAMLQMPQFLYLAERGEPTDRPDRRRLTPHELAARLSYALWDTTPDDELLAAAAAGELDTPEGLYAQVERLLGHARAKEAIASFHLQWLKIEGLEYIAKDPKLYPTFGPEMRAGMMQETVDFVDYVIRGSDSLYSTLMSAPFSLVNPAVAPIYGLSPAVDPSLPTALDPAERGGVLLHASVLAQHSRFNKTSPVLRGVFVRRNVLCTELGSPPPNIDTSLDEPEFGEEPKSAADILKQHREDPACAGCHDLIDPVGVSLEHYGALGERRETDNGVPIPEAGELTATDVDGAIASGPDLAQRLARSQVARDCYALQMFRFTAGRREKLEDACEVDQLTARFASTDGHIRDLIEAIVMSDTFRHRGEIEGE